MSALDDEIIAMYLAEPRLSVASICTEMHIYPPQLYQTLDRHGIPRRGRKLEGPQSTMYPQSSPRIREEDEPLVALVMKDYRDEHLSAREIARKRMLPYTWVLSALKSKGIDMMPGRNSRKWRSMRQAILEDLTVNSLSLEEVVIKHGINHAALYKLLNGEARRAYVKDFKRPEFIETVINEALLRLREFIAQEIGSDGSVQLKLDV